MNKEQSTSKGINVTFALSMLVIIIFTTCMIKLDYINDFICSLQKPIHFDNFGISFDYPKNLEVKSGYGYKIFSADFFRSNDGNHKLCIDSVSLGLYSDKTVEGLIKDTLDDKKIGTKYKSIIKRKDLTIDGKNATSAIFVGTNIFGLSVKAEKIFIQNGKKIYIFELETREDRFERGKKDFDKIIQSVKFTS